jgi:TldD protein
MYMLAETTVRKILDLGLSRGADFAEVFVEESETSSIDLLQQKLYRINSGNAFGVGIRLLFGNESAYGYSSDVAEDALLQLTANLARSAKEGRSSAAFHKEQVANRHPVMIDPASVSKQERVGLLRQLDELTRQTGSAIRQVGASVADKTTPRLSMKLNHTGGSPRSLLRKGSQMLFTMCTVRIMGTKPLMCKPK